MLPRALQKITSCDAIKSVRKICICAFFVRGYRAIELAAAFVAMWILLRFFMHVILTDIAVDVKPQF